MSKQDPIIKLTKKWEKSKAKLESAKAEELALREQIDALLVKNGEQTAEVIYGGHRYKHERQQNMSIPKAAIPAIQAGLKKGVFASLFNTSYSLKKTVYQNMDAKTKSIIDEHMIIKPSPLKVTVKEV